MVSVKQTRRWLGRAAALLVCAATGPNLAVADTFRSPEVLVLGDSQISFGAGMAFLDFMSDIDKSCGLNGAASAALGVLTKPSIAVIGVRSTSLPSWVARGKQAKSALCDEDPKYKVNAGSYGIVNTSDNPFVQIGKGVSYQFCQAGKSGFEAMFAKGYYAPKLLILYFLGNSAERWAKSSAAALEDVQALMRQLPKGQPCIFMTTAPAFGTKTLDVRMKAQDHLKAAFAKSGSQCSFVAGHTPETIAEMVGNKANFRQKANGMVKDPYHPNAKAAAKLLAIERSALCKAILTQIANR